MLIFVVTLVLLLVLPFLDLLFESFLEISIVPVLPFLVFESSFNTDTGDNCGCTAVMHAASVCQVETLTLLLDRLRIG